MIGAYYPAFNQVTSSNEILFAYRRFYPTNTVIMVNDAGDHDLAHIGAKYKCEYFYEDENIGYPGGREHHEQIIRWVKRFLKYVQLMTDEWFLLLEDDVFIMDAVDVSTLKYDINGINPSNLLPRPSVSLVHARGHCIDQSQLIYGAMGGAIFRTSFFKEMATRIDEVEADLNAFGMACPPSLTGQNWYYSDVVLSFLTYLYGGTLGQYPQFAELWFSDLGTRLAEKRVATLNQYKYLYKYPAHPYLISSRNDKYSIVIPTRGTGDAFDIFIDYAMPRYAAFLDWSEIDQFIIVCPASNVEHVKNRISATNLPISIVTDEEICSTSCDGWMKQQIIKLAISDRIKTDHYLLLDDDLLLVSPLRFSNFFDSTGKIYYSFEAWPTSIVPKDGETHFATNPRWWMSAASLSRVYFQPLTSSKNLMGVTPQLVITRIVHQMIHSLGSKWISNMIRTGATEFCLYWIFLLKTLRTEYYTPSNFLFEMNNDFNILLTGLSPDEIKTKITAGLNQKQNRFIVIQSWIKYPKSIITSALDSSSSLDKSLESSLDKSLESSSTLD